MGLMQKLRSGTKYTIWILIISFGVLWVLADTQVFDAVMVGPQAMGEVNRESITYSEFNDRLSQYTERYRQQTGDVPNMEIRAQYEAMIWDELVLDRILKQKMNELGLAVTDLELVEMVTGDNPDPFIRQQFAREDGSIDRVALQNAIAAPENAPIWVLIEQQLREQRRQQKLGNLIETSTYVSDFEIRQEYRRQNSTASLRYLRFPFSDIDDEDIEITETDIRNFYRANQDQFKREQSWRFTYVTFSKDATVEDTLRTLNRLATFRTEFANTSRDSIYLIQRRSETNYFTNFLRPNDVRPEHLIAFDLEPGQVSEPFVFGTKAHLIKLLETRPSDQTYTRARQIVLQGGSNVREQNLELANNLLAQLREGSTTFASLARQHSVDRQTSQRGGELGFISREDRDAAITTPIFNAAPGNLVGPIVHNDQIFIFEVTGRTNRDIRFADISRTVEADPMETVERMASMADDFAYFAREDGFEVEAQRAGLEVQEAIATKGNPFISGLGQSQIILNSLQEMRRGRISDVIETDDFFIVLRLDQITEAGVRPLDEVRQQIEPQVRSEKRRAIMERRVAQLRDQFSDMDELAENQGKTPRSVSTLRMNATNITGAGREPIVVGAAFGVETGMLSRPIVGENAVFLLFVESRTMADPSQMSSADRRQIADRLQQSKNQAFGSVWVDRLKDGARIRDHRRFHTQM